MQNKEIPLKVIDNGYGVAFCPVCHGSVWQNKDESNYCFRCGQKIKWD
jgi:alkyl hydroperoxide reductase subunit AhpF